MKKILLTFTAFATLAGVYFGINAMTTKSESLLFMQNVEALARSEGGSGGCTYGYRYWDTKGGLFGKEKEFYDCACILRHGYNPHGNC